MKLPRQQAQAVSRILLIALTRPGFVYLQPPGVSERYCLSQDESEKDGNGEGSQNPQ